MTADNEPSVPDIDQLARSMLALHGAHGDEHPVRQRGNRGSTAPVVPSDPKRAEALREATQRDRERYLSWGLQPVDCRFCHVSVLVRRLGPGHTSVQWNSQAAQRCAYFAEVREAGGDTARIPTCPKLADSIDHAIAEGILEPAPSAPPPGDG
ncbi:MAG TPA: hypothetical protein VFA16_16395 [Mycobacterium sp.]|uniref:hypothetical protein n=1 Tax=Mycobacterium sp. TaxID=1785 RepID=UPI002D49AB6B|nr:hypothetical protein [Mycobacterium sp.]HZU48806.1 hypothetical protein [Mycobacterium sp.]